MAGYYRRFLPHFSEVTLPITEMLKKNKNFEWSESAEKSFIELKSRLASRPILRPPDYNEKFFLAVDASFYCVGGCLFQMYEGIEHPVCYFSRKLNKHQINYSIVEKEAYSLLLAVRLFSVYFGSNSVVVFTDHSPLKAIASMLVF